ncbi:MAG: hypothetical protein EXR14_02380 [Pelagibacteraceae bacterium]|nr:hypothetical protein [Pelagibacteraceae bacterium]PHX89378.1 MAG: hypothetical protein CK535_02110 [Pelagibacteraceae bacterium]
MIENFNGIIYLVIFLIHFLIYAVFGFRYLFDTKSYLDKYGMGDGAAITSRFLGSIYLGSVLMAIWVGFIRAGGLESTWAFFNLIFLQNVCTFIFALWFNQKGNLGVNEKTSTFGIFSPGILTVLSAILCYGLADKIYI